jgi:replicative DNA helicase
MTENTNYKSKNIPGILKNDRPLPHNEDAESAVIAALLTEPDSCVDEAMELLGNAAHFYEKNKKGDRNPAPAIFYNPRNQLIYSSLCDMHESENKIDIITLSHYLRQKNLLADIGGEEYLLNLMGSIASTANLETWCILVRESAILRNLIDTCSSIQDKCYSQEAPASSILDEVEQRILNVSSLEERSQTFELKDLIDHKRENSAFNYLINLAKKEENTTGILTGFPDLDKIITGLKPGEMFVLAARPSIGKTSFALNLVSNIAIQKGKSVAFFSLEMTAEQLARRMLCTECGYSEKDFYNGNVTNINRVTQAASDLCKAKIYIDPTPALRIRELRSKARKLMSLHKIEAIFIDYLQLMKAEIRSDSRQEEVSAISSGIKALSKELNVPIVVLAQLNREVEKTQGTPKLSHLRESGAIEQDADIVAFLHRNRKDQQDSSFEAQTKGQDAQLIIEKNRNGGTGPVDMLFFPHLMKFACKTRYGEEDIP